MTVKQNESGFTLRVAACFDMSSNTEITLVIRKPDGFKLTKTRTGGDVVLGLVNVTDPDLGALLANQYVEYNVEVGVLDLVGVYSVELKYEDSASSELLYGGTVQLESVRNVDD